AFLAAWNETCGSTGNPTLLIPSGKTYLVGPVTFSGPCKADSITVQVDGTVMASTELHLFGEEWVLFGWLNNLVVTGKGTFDGQGSSAWPYNVCPFRSKCKILPCSLKFAYTNNTVVSGITSLNSKFFHYALLDNTNFKADNLRITAPNESPNTDGIHLERCRGVSIIDSQIGTGDDCISIGPGNSDVLVKNIKCGPGHGISVGSLGKYPEEGNVEGLLVTDCKLTGTLNGVRIKTWEGSPTSTVASNVTFDNIFMNAVSNPIVIDQTYCPYTSCPKSSPSRVKIQGVTFSNIRGSSATEMAVMMECSEGFPCQDVNLKDVQLQYSAGTAKASCLNVRANYSGVQVPPPCSN
ncbi:Polygalacturonase, partial [Nymphaea thermarum]